ncbi:hypothetical protein [Pseudoalteromonas marina]|uniref:hypothetical protein n=1 Tax=Pseudoalteromonas marina TaxID=267375 RepID=UPI003C468925
MRTAIAITIAISVSGCATLGPLNPHQTVPHWGVTYTGDIPAADDVTVLAEALEQVTLTFPRDRRDDIRGKIAHIEIWFRKAQLVKNRHTGEMAPGLFHAPRYIEIAVGDRRRIGDTALVYEVYRVLHRAIAGASLSTSAKHQEVYGERIAHINDCLRGRLLECLQ